jgi:hypothetical protein
MGKPTTKTELLLVVGKELIKQCQILDVYGRPLLLYTAPHWAKTGDSCIITEFIYVDTVSTTLKGKQDGYGEWDESFIPDSSFTVADIYISKTEHIITNENEITKQYQELDSQLRPSKIFEAGVFATQGTPCKVTEYVYQNATSTVFKGKKESYATWDISWVPDSAFTVTF